MRIAVFDWLKVVLKVFIIVTHVTLITSQIRSDLLFPFWINQAVPPFWMISAFLLARAYERHGAVRVRDEMGGVLVRRLSRVAVPYTAIFVPMMLIALH